MERSTFVLLLLGILMVSGLIFYRYQGSSKPPEDATGYKWDSEGPCTNAPDQHYQTCSQKSNPTPKKPERVCDRKGLSPGLQCQLKIMSKRVQSKTIFSNSFGLPNLGSYYIGARASVLKNTSIYTGCRSEWAWCNDQIFLNEIIQPGLLIVGKNFRFKGKQGSILIELAEPALISGVTLIHPLKCEIPNGYFSSAPKHFSVYGLTTGGVDVPDDSLELGRYTYRQGGSRAQTFPVMSNCIGSEWHKRVLVNFEDNYGNEYYTAVYKLEIHGLFMDKDTGEPMKDCSECG